MARVRQDLPRDHISDVRTDVREKLKDFGIARQSSARNRIAITAGSRGIGGLDGTSVRNRGCREGLRRRAIHYSCDGEPWRSHAGGTG